VVGVPGGEAPGWFADRRLPGASSTCPTPGARPNPWLLRTLVGLERTVRFWMPTKDGDLPSGRGEGCSARSAALMSWQRGLLTGVMRSLELSDGDPSRLSLRSATVDSSVPRR